MDSAEWEELLFGYLQYSQHVRSEFVIRIYSIYTCLYCTVYWISTLRNVDLSFPNHWSSSGFVEAISQWRPPDVGCGSCGTLTESMAPFWCNSSKVPWSKSCGFQQWSLAWKAWFDLFGLVWRVNYIEITASFCRLVLDRCSGLHRALVNSYTFWVPRTNFCSAPKTAPSMQMIVLMVLTAISSALRPEIWGLGRPGGYKTTHSNFHATSDLSRTWFLLGTGTTAILYSGHCFNQMQIHLVSPITYWFLLPVAPIHKPTPAPGDPKELLRGESQGASARCGAWHLPRLHHLWMQDMHHWRREGNQQKRFVFAGNVEQL